MTRITLGIAALSLSLTACGGGATTNTSNSAPNANASSANNAAANDPLATTRTKAEEPATNAAPTLIAVVKAYCDAWVKNDEAALRKVFSTDTIKYFENEMKADKEKSLLKWLDDERVSGTPCEASNEVITGDNATAMVKTNKTPNGVKRVFVKENGEWKLTNKVPDIESVKKAAPGQAPKSNSNSK